MSLPDTADLIMYRGDSFSTKFKFQTSAGSYINLTGCIIRAQLRESEDSSTVVQSLSNVLESDGLTVTVSFTPQVTALLPETSVWDLEVTWPDGTVHTYVRGIVLVYKDVTR